MGGAGWAGGATGVSEVSAVTSATAAGGGAAGRTGTAGEAGVAATDAAGGAGLAAAGGAGGAGGRTIGAGGRVVCGVMNLGAGAGGAAGLAAGGAGAGAGAHHGRTRSRRTGRCRSGCRLLLLRNQLQHISWLGDVREVDLGLDFICVAPRAWRTRRRARFGRSAEVGPHFLCLVVLERTGMGLLLGDSDFGENIENRFAFNFQLPGQIVDSNLTHPPFLCSAPSP